MPPLYIIEQGAKISVEQRRLLVHKDDEQILQAPMVHLNAVICFGNIGLTTPAMKRLMAAGIDVVFLTRGGSYEGRLVGPLSKFGLLRQAQYNRLREEAGRLPLAQQFVLGKCLNMRTFLMRYNRELRDEKVAAAAERILQMADRTERTTRIGGLLGVEGAASAAYFGVFRRLFKRDWTFDKRLYHPAPDPVNALLSFSYTLLTRDLEASVALVGLDPYVGAMHTIEYGRPSLALDLAEEFRSIVSDSVVLRCLNNDLITRDDFTPGDEPGQPVRLGEKGKRALIGAYEERMATVIRHPVTNEQMQYRRVFEVQTRLLARCLREPGVAYQPFLVR